MPPIRPSVDAEPQEVKLDAVLTEQFLSKLAEGPRGALLARMKRDQRGPYADVKIFLGVSSALQKAFPNPIISEQRAMTRSPRLAECVDAIRKEAMARLPEGSDVRHEVLKRLEHLKGAAEGPESAALCGDLARRVALRVERFLRLRLDQGALGAFPAPSCAARN